MNSYGLWIATEINEHYDCDDSRSSFIKVAFGRQVAAVAPLVLWDLNPCSPSHRIYKDYIDLYKTQYIGGYQYQHFTINDNLSISEERKREIESQYVKGSIWYRRDILGERCIAEGLVYPMWEEALSKPPKDIEPSDYCLSMDYGTMNAFACLLWVKYGSVWYATDGYYYSGREEGRQLTDEEYCEILVAKFGKLGNNMHKLRAIVDPSAASFIAALRKKSIFKVLPANNAVMDGIRNTAVSMQAGVIKVDPALTFWSEEAGGYVWDDNEVEDRPVKIADHCLTGDTLVYTENGYIPICKLIGKSGKVWSFNLNTQQAELKPFTDCRKTQKNAPIYKITLADGKMVRCTGEHPILTEYGYIRAKYLALKDKVMQMTGEAVEIKSIEFIGYEDVYNMEVEDNHNFIVNGGIVVHNCMDATRYFVQTMGVYRNINKQNGYKPIILGGRE